MLRKFIDKILPQKGFGIVKRKSLCARHLGDFTSEVRVEEKERELSFFGGKIPVAYIATQKARKEGGGEKGVVWRL